MLQPFMKILLTWDITAYHKRVYLLLTHMCTFSFVTLVTAVVISNLHAYDSDWSWFLNRCLDLPVALSLNWNSYGSDNFAIGYSISLVLRGAIIFFGRGVPNLQKVSIKKLRPPISATKILWPPITDTLYLLNRLKFYWNQSFWTK